MALLIPGIKRNVAQIILQHHERNDGSGYPNSLRGEEQSPLARIVAVADIYDAMTSDRPYRSAMSRDAALAELERNKGRQFCPRVVTIFRESMLSFPDDLYAMITENEKTVTASESVSGNAVRY
jgi:HD-GYP domain-containing protein (c-di-GMP phosphodiesterase class II)